MGSLSFPESSVGGLPELGPPVEAAPGLCSSPETCLGSFPGGPEEGWDL